MKHLTPYILTAILGLTLSFNAQAQSPEKFNYQAVLRNNGNLVVNDAVDVRFTIHDLTATGTTVYQETHSTTTDQYGLINVAVGAGTVVSGTFSSINWSAGAKYLQVEVDYGPGGYEDLGARQLLSVPYALHAGSGGGSWSTTGNAGITPANFVGTTDTASLRFKVNNQPAGFITYDDPYNTAFGQRALDNNTTGKFNTAFGTYSLDDNTTGSHNTAFGMASLYKNTIGDRNTALGRSALVLNTTGIANTAVGYFSLNTNDGGDYNTATGIFSLKNNLNNNNSAFGAYSLYGNTSGTRNSALGHSALYSNTTGYNNTAIGAYADVGDTNLNNATAIGYKAYVAQSNSIVLGSINGVNSATANVNVGIGTTTPSASLHIKQSGNSEEALMLEDNGDTDNWSFEIVATDLSLYFNGSFIGAWDDANGNYTAFSDRRLKKDIVYIQSSILDRVMQLKPAWYHFKRNESSMPKTLGFIAQDVQKVFPKVVQHTENGYLGLHYPDFGILAIKAIQEQQKIIESQDTNIQTLENNIVQLQQTLKKMQARMAALEQK